MDSKRRILRHFIENRSKRMTILNVSRSLKINYRIVYESIKELSDTGLIDIIHLGNSNLCTFSGRLDDRVFWIESIRSDELQQDPDIKVIKRRIEEIEDPFYILLLFGSYARGTKRKGSDIDLCIISDSKDTKERLAHMLGLIPLDIHPLYFTSSQFQEMLRSADNNVGKEIVENNVIIKGIEPFYRLVRHACRGEDKGC